MTVKLLPHGNAKEAYDEERGMWNFKCQFGPKECMANLIETCAIFLAERQVHNGNMENKTRPVTWKS